MNECLSISPNGFLCTRADGHKGLHRAEITDEFTDKWRDEEAA